MAEVIDHWPGLRERGEKRFRYPWDQWIDLDEGGLGDIWLASLGIDFPEDSNVWHFRSTLYTRAQALTRQRKKRAPTKLMRVKGTNKVRRVPDYVSLRVKVKIVSDTQVAFQFYEGDEVPAEPEVTRVAVPVRRQPLRQRMPVTSPLQKVLVSK